MKIEAKLRNKSVSEKEDFGTQVKKINDKLAKRKSFPEVTIHDYLKLDIPRNTFHSCQVSAARNYRIDTLAFLKSNFKSVKKSEKDEKHSVKFRGSNVKAFDSMRQIPTFRLFNVCVPYWF